MSMTVNFLFYARNSSIGLSDHVTDELQLEPTFAQYVKAFISISYGIQGLIRDVEEENSTLTYHSDH